MNMLLYYLDLALRAIWRNRALSALMVLALSVGIGACMTTITVYHLLSGDPLPGRSKTIFYPQLDGDPKHSNAKAPWDLLDYRTAVDLAQNGPATRSAIVVSSSEKIDAMTDAVPPFIGQLLSTNSDFFSMFDVPFAFGGSWSKDDEIHHARVVVISNSLNKHLFHGANSVGRRISVNNNSFEIIGVLAPWRPRPKFYEVAGGAIMRDSASTFYGRVEDVVMPFATSIELNRDDFNAWYCWREPTAGVDLTHASSCLWVQLWVQLGNSEAVANYKRFLEGYAAQQHDLGRFDIKPKVRLTSLLEWLSYNGVVPDAVKLQVAMAFAFLLVCLCNTVGLLFAKFSGRSVEFGLRRALGATQAGLFWQCLVEAAVIGLLGGIGGLIVTLCGLMVIRRQPFSYADLAHLDLSMFMSIFILSIFCGMLVAIVPALRSAKTAPALQIRSE
ncbi:MAG: ABC transporter permease [Rhodanobacter sp.]